MTNWLIDRINNYSDRIFLSDRTHSYSYSDLNISIKSSLKNFKNAGIKAGDIVILNGDYNIKSIASLLALFTMKAIVAPLSSVAKNEFTKCVEASKAEWKISTLNQIKINQLQQNAKKNELVNTLKERNESGLILFSSGSTGTPKAMIHSAKSFLKRFETKRPKNLRILIFLLFDHIGGINTLFNSLSTASQIIVPKNRDPNNVAIAIEKYQVNLLPASPTFLNLLLISGVHKKHDLSSLRYITYGTEPMPESLLNRIKSEFPKTRLIQTFGTSETGISQTSSKSSSSTLIKFDDPNTEYKIVRGELWIRSKTQILGYLNHNMNRFTKDGWFKTGDILEPEKENEDNGFFRIVGRTQEIINVGGEKVNPSEVENILLEIPEVIDCIVYAEENAITGQIVAAEIVIKDGSEEKITKRYIKNYCRDKLSSFKVPARIIYKQSTEFSKRFKKIRLNK